MFFASNIALINFIMFTVLIMALKCFIIHAQASGKKWGFCLQPNVFSISNEFNFFSQSKFTIEADAKIVASKQL